jgi:hypothetical protein
MRVFTAEIVERIREHLRRADLPARTPPMLQLVR